MRSSHVVLDQVDITFDDPRAVAHAGLLLPATLAERLGIEQATDELVDLGDRTGAAHPGRKLLTLVHAMVAGGDCIDDVELLRCGPTASILGHRVMAASTVGTWLRGFTFGHVRQLDKMTGEVLARAWGAGAGPGDGPLAVDVDSTICEVCGYHKQGACYGYTRRLGYHPLLATRADSGEVLHARLRKGSANTARGILRFVDELVARLRRAGASGELTLRADSGFWSAKHRRHAICELAIRDLKAGAGLAHLPSGRFAANAAWLLAATLAHNLLRWTATLGLGVRDQQTVAKTPRRTLLIPPGRLTHSARQWTLHLPAGWPWAHSFTMALARLRCIPYPT